MSKDFDTWNTLKKQIDTMDSKHFIHEREVWWCSIGLNVGKEQDGKHSVFERPVVVLKKFNRHMVLAVPLTTKVKENRYYFVYRRNGNVEAALISQIRLLSTNRFTRHFWKFDPELFQLLRERIIKEIL